MRCARLFGVVGLLLLLSGKAEALPELVVNGGFETGDFTGWTLVGDSTYLGVVDYNALSGEYVAELGPMGAASHLTQPVPTTAGAAYVVELFIANLGTAPDDIIDNHFSVTFGGTLLYEAFDLDTSNQFLQLTLTGIASGPSTLLDLAFRNDPSFFYLDDVSVMLPEPGTLALLLVGIAGLTSVRRARQSAPVALKRQPTVRHTSRPS
jgi:hypothetical protein